VKRGAQLSPVRDEQRRLLVADDVCHRQQAISGKAFPHRYDAEGKAMAGATYQVRVSGAIPAELLPELDDLTVTVEPPETVLHGSLPDQSALFGLISRIHGLGLRLIEVRRISLDEDSDQPGGD
jgi:hypothetical protein